MSLRILILSTVSATVLANCGSSVVPQLDTIMFSAESVDVSEIGILTIGGTVAAPTFFIDGVEIAGVVDNALVNGVLAGTKFTKHGIVIKDHLIVGRTEGGYVAVGAGEFKPIGLEYLTGVMERTEATELPTIGTAEYKGDYVGLVNERNSPAPSLINDVDFLIVGDAILNVDFDGSSISGSIVNRVLLGPENGVPIVGFPISDVMLGTSLIDSDGNFSGATSGGNITAPSGTNGPALGSYSGMPVGPDGESIIGVLLLPINTGTNYPTDGGMEIGGFIADQQ